MTIDKRLQVRIKPYKEGRLRLKLENFQIIREWPTTSIGLNKLVSKFGDYLEYNDKIPAKLNHLLHERYYQTFVGMNNPKSLHDEKSDSVHTITQQADDATMAFLMLYAALGDSFAKSSRPALDITIFSDIPIGVGLGSSSAYAVALTAALMKVFRVSAEPYVISTWALHIDKFYHKNSSGLSSNAIIHGGYCYYQHNKVKAYGVQHSTRLKVMLIDTEEPRQPREIYDLIEEYATKNRQFLNEAFTHIGELAGSAWRCMNQIKFHPRTIANFIDGNQDLLKSIGLSHPRLQELRELANPLRLAIKQTHCGRAAFLLIDETDIEPQFNEFRNILDERNFKVDFHDISYLGLQVKKF